MTEDRYFTREQLSGIRRDAVALRDSGVALSGAEARDVEAVITRIDAGLRMHDERDQYWRDRARDHN